MTQNNNEKPRRRKPRRKRPRRSVRYIAALPSLATLLNGLCGFAAIHYAAKSDYVLGRIELSNFALAGWLIVLAMIFDAIDGRLARLTRVASEFGGQLDSLCDVISFGVAPAFLMIQLLAARLSLSVSPAQTAVIGKFVWIAGAIYVGCAALRLARFNIETTPVEADHLTFRGLPSPGAAGVVASAVIVHEQLYPTWPATMGILVRILPVVVFALALLMVSRIRYIHLINAYLQGGRPFSFVLRLVIGGALFVLYPALMLAFCFWVYALSGPVGLAWQRLFGVRVAAQKSRSEDLPQLPHNRKPPAGLQRWHDD